MTTSLTVRESLIDALQLDLIGPSAGHRLADELLPGTVRPSNWYLSGFLIPLGTPQEQAADDDDDEENNVEAQPGALEEPAGDRKAAKRSYFPSSIGLTFLTAAAAAQLQVTVSWGDYLPIGDQTIGETVLPEYWQRVDQAQTLTVDLAATVRSRPRSYDVPQSGGLQLDLVVRPIDRRGGLPPGTRAVSLYLVNRRLPQSERPDQRFAFQCEIDVVSEQPFVARPDPRGSYADEWDELIADLHYRDTPEYAVGHGVAADWELVNGRCFRLRTTWLPQADVEKTVTVEVPGLLAAMDHLADLADGAAAAAALQPLVAQYRRWIDLRREDTGGLSGQQQETALELIRRAEYAAGRIERGIALLRDHADVLDAFRTANRAVSRALKQRNKIASPQWRAFQLAFLLLNLSGIADPLHPDRETVDLLFFPTGGGKTEAYLGLAAFTLVLRRLRNPADDGRAGAGVSVVMRYTLRLLTLDQLARAAGMICALELVRSENPERYGSWPFEIGLWVGKGATPNRLGSKADPSPDTARAIVNRFKADSSRFRSPIPLESCPWCNARFTAASFNLMPDSEAPNELRITCSSLECDFIRERSLPIVAVDESVYRRLPAFIVATVDKFAALPWTAESGMLLGGADRADAGGFYGPADPQRGRPLSQALLPPDLIIQDELHLISGPLGTMVGLYETAIDALCTRTIDAKPVRPKIIASTATVRRAESQIQALFGRAQTDIFPPSGITRNDSFFAETKPASAVAARRYLGVAAQGRSPKVVMRKVWLALMGAAQQAYVSNGGPRKGNPADPYMTVLGYFNNLRELGGARRILEEEVRSTVAAYGKRKRLNELQGSFADRTSFGSVLELTSRVTTAEVADTRRRLDTEFDRPDSVDCALATNMISVGLDIQRLGLMVAVGQPMLTSEYIQATSRVGRDDQRPGLVVTLLNFHRARDRSHYERFRHFHETFYRSVEVSSVTPFAARALDRGFAGMLVGLARHLDHRLTPVKGAARLSDVRGQLESRLIDILQQRIAQQSFADSRERLELSTAVQDRIVDLLDAWVTVLNAAGPATFGYQRYEQPRAQQTLLAEMLEQNITPAERTRFRAGRSLRDVEPNVNVFLRDLSDEVIEIEP